MVEINSHHEKKIIPAKAPKHFPGQEVGPKHICITPYLLKQYLF